MIKSNELRIGNYLCNAPWFDMVVVEEIRKEVIKCNIGFGEIEKLQPIILTEEWLIKLGFEWEESYIKLDFNPRMKIEFYMANSAECDIVQDNKTISFKNNQIKYVHQLQNLFFALTGEELTIK